MRRKTAEHQARLGRLEESLARIEGVLNLGIPGGLAAVHSDVKDAKTSAASAAAGVHAVADDVHARLAGKMAFLADQVKALAMAVAAVAPKPEAPAPAAPPPAGSPGTAGAKTAPKRQM